MCLKCLKCHFYKEMGAKGVCMDFYRIKVVNKESKGSNAGVTGTIEISPDFIVGRSKDLMVRAKSFYAIWDRDRELWSTDEYDVQRIVDSQLTIERERQLGLQPGKSIIVKYMSDFSTRSWANFRYFLTQLSDSYTVLDETLTFLDDKRSKNDYISKRLPYSLTPGSHSSWDEMMDVLYDPDEREKIEWAIGSIVAGEGKNIQKFLVIYGEAGGGKSTTLNIIQKLFEGYYTTFDSQAITGKNNSFSTDVFRLNPLVAIEHDGDLSKISDTTKLNSIVSHEEMMMSEKFKPNYTARSNAFLFMGTNRPVKISEAKSGIIRRLIDVRTSGRKLENKHFLVLVSQIDFELGAIAHHCLDVFRKLGKNYYSNYKPVEMMLETDFFYNFIEEYFSYFSNEESIMLTQAYDLYKTYCLESNTTVMLPRHKFREELRNYFRVFQERGMVSGKQVRSVYSQFKKEKFTSTKLAESDDKPYSIVLDRTDSLLDVVLSDAPAQLARSEGTPSYTWKKVKTTLKDIDTKQLHYVKLPPNHIVIDFDLKDESGEKSLERNLEEAVKWPPTYAEYSKSGKGIHLHYIYDGDTNQLDRVYGPDIEIKVPVGNASLRRQLSMCNNIPIAHINSGLPLKGEPSVINQHTVKSERGLITLIERNLTKEIHPATKPSIDFIYKILEDAYASGIEYDLTHMRPTVLKFAINSTNHSEYCVDLVSKMKFISPDKTQSKVAKEKFEESELVFFDVEVYSNLVLISWKYKGNNKKPVRMINPSRDDISELMKFNLVGFNCRRYDNHILYALYLGYTIEQVFDISSKIIGNSKSGFFREAYNVSFADVYDFTSEKKSLKAWQVELGILHKELDIPWDQPVDESLWEIVGEYCDNDVISTEAVFNHRKQDFVARQILAELSGLLINDTTRAHTAKIIFGDDPNPQKSFIYTDLSKTFPGYTFEQGKSTYRGEDPSEGGYVYAEPGMYSNVALLDVASMHPSSILAMNMFGKYTPRYKELLEARLAIKHGKYDLAKTLLGGMLKPYLDDPKQASDLAYALKIHALNIVYGLTSAKFPNPFKDERNVDNIVAKRGALFMIDLKHAIHEQGFVVAHIKTDSVKIPNATEEIIKFVFEFGEKYGYTFEHEATYKKFCLVNNAVYVAQYADGGYKAGQWTATGAEFIHPYVFKTIFSKERVTFLDMCETKAVTSPSVIYLDMNEGLAEGEHDYRFVGKTSSFVPIKSGKGGGILYRFKDEKYYAITGTKGYRWLEASLVKTLKKEKDIDENYYSMLINNVIEHISKFGDYERFVAND